MSLFLSYLIARVYAIIKCEGKKKEKMRVKLEGNEEEDGVGERLGKVIEM